MAVDISKLLALMSGQGRSQPNYILPTDPNFGAKNAPFPEPAGQDMPARNSGIGGLGAGSAPPGAGFPYGKGGGGDMMRGGGGRMSPGGMPSPMGVDAAGGIGTMNEGVLKGRRAQLEQQRQALYARMANLTREMGMYQGEAAAGNPSAQAQVQRIQSEIQAIQMQMQQLEVQMQQVERDWQEMMAEEQRRQGPGGVRAGSDGPVRGYFGGAPGSGPSGPSLGSNQLMPDWMTGKSGGGGLGFSGGGGGGGGGSRPPRLRPNDVFDPWQGPSGHGGQGGYQTYYGWPSPPSSGGGGGASYGPGQSIGGMGNIDYSGFTEEELARFFGYQP